MSSPPGNLYIHGVPDFVCGEFSAVVWDKMILYLFFMSQQTHPFVSSHSVTSFCMRVFVISLHQKWLHVASFRRKQSSIPPVNPSSSSCEAQNSQPEERNTYEQIHMSSQNNACLPGPSTSYLEPTGSGNPSNGIYQQPSDYEYDYADTVQWIHLFAFLKPFNYFCNVWSFGINLLNRWVLQITNKI